MNALAIPAQPAAAPLEYRKQVLQVKIAWLTHYGYKLVSQTDTTAQMVMPRGFSCLWASLWFLLFGVGIVIYLFYYWAKKDRYAYVLVDDFGVAHITYS